MTELSNENLRKIKDAFDLAWEKVFKVTNHFLAQHDQFGFSLIKELSDPRLEDMLFVLKVMNGILNVLDNQMSIDEQRLLLNAKQQIILFERITMAVQKGDEEDYSATIRAMKNQAQI